MIEQLEDRRLLATVTNTNDSGPGSLRQAILDTNASATDDVIVFNIQEGEAPFKIAPSSDRLPAITDQVFLDATTQPGWAGTPIIEISGEHSGEKVWAGIRLTDNSHGSTIKGLALNRFTVSPAASIAVLSNGNTITENYIGVDVSGDVAVDTRKALFVAGSDNIISNNLIGGLSGLGIQIADSSGVGAHRNQVVDNRIGTNADGTSALPIGNAPVLIEDGTGNIVRGNLISGSLNDGVRIVDATNTVVQGNQIGTNANGDVALGNSGNGVLVRNSTGTIIGGANLEDRNLISGNGVSGVRFMNSSDSVVRGNYIGTDTSGLVDIGNEFDGVTLQQATTKTLVFDNLIAGSNRFSGVVMFDGGTEENEVYGNLIGTDLTGKSALSNNTHGVHIFGAASNNIIGGPTEDHRNVISGNLAHGVLITGASTKKNHILGNYVGTDIDGNTALKNGHNGIQIQDGANENVIGVDDTNTSTDAPLDSEALNRSAEGNVISGNEFEGINITGVGTDRNIVAGNFVGTNATGTAGIGNGNNGIMVRTGAQQNRIGTDADGRSDLHERNIVSATLNFNGIAIRETDTKENTVAGNFVGTDVTGQVALGNGGSGLAIHLGASNNMIGGPTEVQRNLFSGNAHHGVWISDADFNHVMGNYIGTNVDGSEALPNAAEGVVIRDGAIRNIIGLGDGNSSTDAPIDANVVNRSAEGNVISGNGKNGIWIGSAGTSANNVAGNFIGTDATGTQAIGNTHSGIIILSGAAANLIGTNVNNRSDDLERNIISGTTNWNGITIRGDGTDRNAVSGNYIGTDVTGTISLGNGLHGIEIDGGAKDNVVGHPLELGAIQNIYKPTRNIISGNTAHGIQIDGSGTESNLVFNNYIGTTSDGNTALPNQGNGVFLADNASANVIGRTVSGFSSDIRLPNHLSGNGGNGIRITSGATTNEVIANQIGVAADGSSLPNSVHSVLIESSGNLVGLNASTANTIASQETNGITQSSSVTGDHEHNVFVGTGQNIDINNDGEKLNDPDDDVLDYPVFEVAEVSDGGLVLEGWVPISTDPTTLHLYLVKSTADGFGQRISKLVSFSGTAGAGGAPYDTGSYGPTVGINDSATVVATEEIAARRFVYSGPTDFFTSEINNGDRLVGVMTASVGAGQNQMSEFGPAINVGLPSTTVTNTNDSGPGSLRRAILNANSIAGQNEIEFDIAGDSPYTIQLQSPLPTITDQVTISGATQRGFVDTPIVTLDGTDAGDEAEGLNLGSGSAGSVISEIVVTSFGKDGINVASSNNLIVGTIVTSNSETGIRLTGTSASNNRIQGNLLGIDSNDVTSGNGTGVLITDGANANFVGTDVDESNDEIEGNVISGNQTHGVEIFGAGSNNNRISGNLIGTSSSGLLPRGNGENGIRTSSGTVSQRIAGTIIGMSNAFYAPARNVVSANARTGINTGLDDGAIIAGNSVGVDADHTTALGNLSGISVNNSQNVTIGGDLGLGNTTVYSDLNGIQVNLSKNVAVRNNFVGTDSTGSVAGGNGVGVSVLNPTGIVSIDSNRIANNSTGLLETIRSSTTLPPIRINFHGNTFEGNDLGIDLDRRQGTNHPNGPGVTLNEPGGRVAHFPIIESATVVDSQLILQGYAQPETQFELYVADPTTTLGYGQGKKLLGTFTEGSADDSDDSVGQYGPHSNGIAVATNTMTENRFEFSVSIPGGITEGSLLTTLAVSPVSEFSPITTVEAILPQPGLVTNTLDSGPGSLRQAILDANASAEVNEVRFNIPGSGPHTITPVSPLPVVTETISIDGTTEPDYIDSPIIVIDGSQAGLGASGITLADGSDSSVIRGLVINSFSPNGEIGGYGIAVDSSNDNLIVGNYLGTDHTGTEAKPNEVGIHAIDSRRNLIGRAQPGDGNLISGNKTGMVARISGFVFGQAVQHQEHVIAGNYIGTDITGRIPLGNEFDGISLSASEQSRVEDNIISGNQRHGVLLNGAFPVSLHNNLIGTNDHGDQLGNTEAGLFLKHSIVISGSAKVGGDVTQANTIAFNRIGVDVSEVPSGIKFQQNSIFDNQIAGILNGNEGINMGGASDFPVIESSLYDGTHLIIAGFAPAGSSIDLYISDESDHQGQGRTFIKTFEEGGAEDQDSTSGSYGPTLNGGQIANGEINSQRFRFSFNPELALDHETRITAVANGISSSSINTVSEFSPVSFVSVIETAPPISSVNSLPQFASGKSFTIEVTGSDAGSSNIPASGIASYDVYVASDHGPYAFWKTLPVDAPSATFDGESNTQYSFISIATDHQGNIEQKNVNSAKNEAWTRVLDFDPPETEVTEVIHGNSATTFDISFQGTEVKTFEVWVSIQDPDTGTYSDYSRAEVVDAGQPDGNGIHTGTFTFNPLRDKDRIHRFYSIGIDENNNREQPPDAGFDASLRSEKRDVFTHVIPFDVQRGERQRSYVRYADLGFDFDEYSEIDDILDSITNADGSDDRVIVKRFNLDGSGTGQAVEIADAFVRLNHLLQPKLELDFGETGLADGYYEISLDVDGDGSTDRQLHFHRIRGDVNGDGKVDLSDLVLMNQNWGSSISDINRDGRSDTDDVFAWIIQFNQRLGDGLDTDD